MKSSAVRIAAADRSRSDFGWPTIVVRFVILEPARQCQLVTSLRSLAAWYASVVFGEAFASGCVGAISTVVTEAFASVRLRSSDGNLSDFARGGLSSIAEGVAASVLSIIVRGPILVLSANSALKNSRQTRASQMVLGIAIMSRPKTSRGGARFRALKRLQAVPHRARMRRSSAPTPRKVPKNGKS